MNGLIASWHAVTMHLSSIMVNRAKHPRTNLAADQRGSSAAGRIMAALTAWSASEAYFGQTCRQA